jgi:hypothetical protein
LALKEKCFFTNFSLIDCILIVTAFVRRDRNGLRQLLADATLPFSTETLDLLLLCLKGKFVSAVLTRSGYHPHKSIVEKVKEHCDAATSEVPIADQRLLGNFREISDEGYVTALLVALHDYRPRQRSPSLIATMSDDEYGLIDYLWNFRQEKACELLCEKGENFSQACLEIALLLGVKQGLNVIVQKLLDDYANSFHSHIILFAKALAAAYVACYHGAAVYNLFLPLFPTMIANDVGESLLVSQSMDNKIITHYGACILQ